MSRIYFSTVLKNCNVTLDIFGTISCIIYRIIKIKPYGELSVCTVSKRIREIVSCPGCRVISCRTVSEPEVSEMNISGIKL